MSLALKIDVDTLVGFQEGVPALLAVLEKLAVPASFFVAMGPDNSGRAIRRVFTRKGFLKKMLRTGAPQLYGYKTMLYGTLWPAPPIALSNPDLFRAIAASGHEVGLHAFDHVHWHDNLLGLSTDAVHLEILRAQRIFVEIMGYPARGFAAPGWQCSAACRAALDAEGFLYASNTRGSSPYFPRFGSQAFPILEIPTTLPTLDEYLGPGLNAEDFFAMVHNRLGDTPVHVLTLHAEAEGRAYLADFTSFVSQAKAQGVQFVRLQDFARDLLKQQDIPIASVERVTLPGRAGEVSCQGPLEEAA